jgi:hypothetical protein
VCCQHRCFSRSTAASHCIVCLRDRPAKPHHLACPIRDLCKSMDFQVTIANWPSRCDPVDLAASGCAASRRREQALRTAGSARPYHVPSMIKVWRSSTLGIFSVEWATVCLLENGSAAAPLCISDSSSPRSATCPTCPIVWCPYTHARVSNRFLLALRAHANRRAELQAAFRCTSVSATKVPVNAARNGGAAH